MTKRILRRHEKLAADTWRMIQAVYNLNLHQPSIAVLSLIEMACDAAADAERMKHHAAPQRHKPKSHLAEHPRVGALENEGGEEENP
jgi:hypothetical protein